MNFYGIGRLTKDPECKEVGDTSVTRFSVACNRKIKDKEYTDFFDCECWGKQGEIIDKYLNKGRKVFIEGRLKQDTWETDGQKRSKILLTVTNFEFIDSASQNESSSSEEPAADGLPF